MEKGKKKPIVLFVFLGIYMIFIILSFITNYEPGEIIFDNFYLFIVDMFKLFPPAFILVGLFMVWVDRKVVEKIFWRIFRIQRAYKCNFVGMYHIVSLYCRIAHGKWLI